MAVNELARLLLRTLMRRLRYTYRHAPADFLSDACEDAIIEYRTNPNGFDPTRGVPLDRFLQHTAARNLADLLKAETRRRRRERRYADQQLSHLAVTASSDAGGGDAAARRRVLAIVDDGTERRTLVRWLEGERRTSVLAAELGVEHLPAGEQRREVKRFKDRVLKRLSRTFGKSGRKG